jgi:arabinose-5-phosphate isomerase
MRRGDDLPVVPAQATMAEAILEMSRKALGCVGVVENERLIGIVTDGDLRRHMGDGLLGRRVAEVMTPHPRTVDRRVLAVEALQIMNSRSITVLFVAENDRPVGALHLHDCLRAGIA